MKKDVTAVLLPIFIILLLYLQEGKQGASLECYECESLNGTKACDRPKITKCAITDNACIFTIGQIDELPGLFRGCYTMPGPKKPPSCQSDSLEIPTNKYGNLTFVGNVCVCTTDLCNNQFILPLSCFQCDTLTNPMGCNFPLIVNCNATSQSCFSATGLVNSKNVTMKGCSDKDVENVPCQSGNIEEVYKGKLYHIKGTECLCDKSLCNQPVSSTTSKRSGTSTKSVITSKSRSTTPKSTTTTLARKATTGTTSTVSRSGTSTKSVITSISRSTTPKSTTTTLARKATTGTTSTVSRSGTSTKSVITSKSRSTTPKSTATTLARKATTGTTSTVSRSFFVVMINIVLFLIVAMNNH